MVRYYSSPKEHSLAGGITSLGFLKYQWLIYLEWLQLFLATGTLIFFFFNIVQITPLVYLNLGILPCSGDS